MDVIWTNVGGAHGGEKLAIELGVSVQLGPFIVVVLGGAQDVISEGPPFAAIAITELDDGLREIAAALALIDPAAAPLLEADALDTQGLRLTDVGRYREAMAAYRAALPLYQRALGPDHPKLSNDAPEEDVLTRGEIERWLAAWDHR